MKIRIRSRIPIVLLMPILLVLAIGLQIACIKKASGPVTPWEKVATYNAALADINQTIEQGAELAVSGRILAKDAGAQVIDFTGRAGTIHKQITAIIQKGANASPSDMVTLQDLLTQISTSGQALVNSGTVGVKNPRSQQTIAQDIASMVSLAQTIISLIPQLTPSTQAMASLALGGDSWTL